MNRGFNRPIHCTQPSVVEYFIEVESDGTLPVANEGNGEATVVKNGNGDYTITLVNPGERIICPRAPLPEVANLQPQLVSVSASAVNVKFTNNSGTATDTKFWIGIVVGYDLVRRT